ncbi:hypothetical protein [Conexibacter arvalis]|uniref:Uncharacterized protein n=1 Tax=Conexibacter arvalis TaxID=912552 RepID=A0A840IFE8_9ACTN|nr:hypothetical protein [Conexibacter arvalis]MBB4662670.1 hypothetical protein [Conexibacter arvalis]
MGQRSRKRMASSGAGRATSGPGRAGEASGVVRDDAARRAARSRTSRREQAPEAPWGRFPLVELCVLSAIALGIAGFVVGGRSGNVLLTGAVLMGSVAGLEVALREHLGGYRSHTLVLSATLAVATMAVMFFARVGRSTMVPIALAVFVLAFMGFRALFKKRSGGFGVKVR